MGLDIRLPIGLMFTLFGLLLVVYGFFSDTSIYQRSLGLNVNLGWGVVLLIFGVVMLVLGRRGTSTAEPADASQEGRKMMKEIAEREVAVNVHFIPVRRTHPPCTWPREPDRRAHRLQRWIRHACGDRPLHTGRDQTPR